MSSTFGKNIKISIFGESHGPAVGVVIDGLPAGIQVDLNELNSLMRDRMGIDMPGTTPRKEKEKIEFLSGIRFDSRFSIGITSGTPLGAIIRNENVKSKDYSDVANVPRPGHADYTQVAKWGEYGILEGGGHLSGRLTAPLAVAGGICMQVLEKEGISVHAGLLNLGGHALTEEASEEFGSDFFKKEITPFILEAEREGDSLGGILWCTAEGLPPGVGEPIFDKVESRLGQMIFSIPGVKGLEFGDGFACAVRRGSENNDAFRIVTKNSTEHIDASTKGDEHAPDYLMTFGTKDNTDNITNCAKNFKSVELETNHCGGLLGGITTGGKLQFRVAVKPTPSIGKTQRTVNLLSKKNVLLNNKGRHDVAVAIRAVPVVKAVTALVLYDLLIDYKESRND